MSNAILYKTVLCDNFNLYSIPNLYTGFILLGGTINE